MQEHTIIHFEKVRAAYRVDPVLHDIDWQWLQGQQWAILGGNGAGKTAIAHLLTDRLRPQRGTLTRSPDLNPDTDILHLSFELQKALIDHDIRFDDSDLREDAFDIGTTVRQIVLQGDAEDERFRTIVERCHIDHILDRGIRFVSTGESRKTLLARALLHQPRLLILDNPFEGLDIDSQRELATLIDTLLHSSLHVLLLIKQRSEIPPGISHILELEAGRVLHCGPRQEVLNSAAPSSATLALGELPAAVARPYTIDRDSPLLELKHVNVSYGDQPILTDINWTLNWGQHCCIAGPNGAGKSTLLSLISGDNHKAYGQHIRLFGKLRGSGESIWDLRKKFGIVNTPLQLNHVGLTRVAEVIASGLYDSVGLYRECSGRDRNTALQWLEVMGLEEIATHCFNQLSFGQQRLAMLARAMVKSPLILILDEPCIGLDEAHRQLILAMIDKIAARGDCHILYVSHSIAEQPRCINQQLTLSPHPQGGYTSHIR